MVGVSGGAKLFALVLEVSFAVSVSPEGNVRSPAAGTSLLAREQVFSGAWCATCGQNSTDTHDDAAIAATISGYPRCGWECLRSSLHKKFLNRTQADPKQPRPDLGQFQIAATEVGATSTDRRVEPFTLGRFLRFVIVRGRAFRRAFDCRTALVRAKWRLRTWSL